MKLPLKAVQSKVYANRWKIYDSEGVFFAGISSKEDADYIVKACNSYHKLHAGLQQHDEMCRQMLDFRRQLNEA